MASSMSENCKEHAVAWELSKENVKPVKSGRSVTCIQAVLQPSEEDAERLMNEKQRFEEDIIAGEQSEDPIAPWHRYLEWTIQNFPTGRNTKAVAELLSKFIGKFKGGQYNDDARYVNAWLKLAEIMDDPLEIYSFMNTERIGRFQAEFYVAWADVYERYGDTKRANRIYTDGMTKGAVPTDLLQKRHVEFQLRIARGFLISDSPECDGNERVAFNQLESQNKHGSVGSMRVGTAFKPTGNLQNTAKFNTMSSQSDSWKIYEDNSDVVTVMGEAGKWASMPPKSRTKENDVEPGKWNGSVDRKQKAYRCPTAPEYSQANFEIYEDGNQDETVPEVQHRSVAKSVLADKKDAVTDFSQIKSVLHEMPVHDEKSKSYYEADKVYTVMGEMQFEEVRAAFWRKKQRIIAEQKHNLEQRRLEEQKAQLMHMEQARMEEERMLVVEKMRIMEIERKMMVTKRMKMKQHKLDLETRLREIKALEKTAITREEAENLNREEEDITVQLGAVENNLKRSAKFEQIKGDTMQSSKFGLHSDENMQLRDIDRHRTVLSQDPIAVVDEEAQYLTSGIQKDMASGNNSLNHSRRSQPSPTVNTKEAMNHVSAWFQKSLDDDEFAENSVCQSANYNTERSKSVVDQKTAAVDENAAPFEIFVENSQDVQALPNSSNTKKGLRSRSFHSEYEDVIVSAGECKDFNSHVDGKTDSVFDDVTVAGSHFTAKARMASTPAVSKVDAFQYSQHIGDLSCIPSYQCMQNSAPGVDMSDEKQQSPFTYENTQIKDAYIDDVKQLTPIMEDSKESEKSNIFAQRSACSQSEPSVHIKQSDSMLCNSRMNNPSSSSAQLKTICEGHGVQSDANESSDSLNNFSFWGVQTVGTENVESKSTHSTKTSDDMTFPQKDCAEQPVEDVSRTINNPCPSFIVHDPWGEIVLSGILQKNDSLINQSDVSVVHNNGVLPFALKAGASIEFSGKCNKVGKVIGEGAFAKVYALSNKDLVMKAQLPPCPWEVYATVTARKRLLSQGMYDAAEAIVKIDSAFFYDDCSLLLLPCFHKGTLLDAVNTKRKTMVLKDAVAIYIACEVMKVVHSLHTVGIIHGDIKPDNFMVMPNADREFNTSIKLIDFGRAIDMTEMPKYAMFMKDCGTSGFSCVQMKQNQPWNYHIDYYGIAGTLYVVLFGAYMNVKQSDDGLWKITGKLKRWHDGCLWQEFFHKLINHPTPSNEKLISCEDSPLPKLLEKFEDKISNMADVYSAVNTFFSGL